MRLGRVKPSRAAGYKRSAGWRKCLVATVLGDSWGAVSFEFSLTLNGADREVSYVAYKKGYQWATFRPALDGNEAGLLELAERPPLGVGFNAPLPSHQVRNNEAVGTPQAPQVPEQQPEKQRRDAELTGPAHPRDIDGPGYELTLDR
jgi:hypothetical protein